MSTSLCRIVRADLAMFFLAPELHGPGKEPAPVWSDELSPDQLGDFIRFALHDSGSQRAGAFELTLVTQRALIGENWDAYYADPSVNAFYLPGKIMDAIAFMSWDRDGKKQASIEIHSQRFGTPIFGNEGFARLRLLLPAFQASVCGARVIFPRYIGLYSSPRAVGSAARIGGWARAIDAPLWRAHSSD